MQKNRGHRIALACFLAILIANPCRAESSPDLASLKNQATAGNAEAEFELGTLYWAGYNVVQDYLAAASWLKKAADQGHAEAQCELGLLYQTGTYADGPPQDNGKAAMWYGKAAAQQDACGEFALAALYDSGQGVPHDSAKAKALYAAAAAKGFRADAGTIPLQQVFERFRNLARSLAGVKN